MITAQGLKKLGFKPDTDFELQDDGAGTYIKEWKSGSPQPTESEIETAYVTAQTEYDAKEYARNRAAEYPSIDELVVALWEGVVEERMAAVTKLEIKRQAVKANHSK